LSAQADLLKRTITGSLATTPSKANIAGAPRLSCVKKIEKTGLEEKLPYLFDNRSCPQDSTYLKGILGVTVITPSSFRFSMRLACWKTAQRAFRPAQAVI
jgi:hypothetical protein